MLEKIELTNFKKHSYFSCSSFRKINLFYGPNGAGKTSILEAINLIAPNKTLFNHQTEELLQHEKELFQINLKGTFNTSILYSQNTKIIKINQIEKKPLETFEFFQIFGMTPFLSLAFWKDSSIRRKYLDRIILQHEPTLGRIYLEYSKLLKQRNFIIEKGQYNTHWVSAIEPKVKELGLIITKIREKILKKIENLAPELEEFLGSKLQIIATPTQEEQQIIFEKKLDINFIGPHVTKFSINCEKFPGKLASTGQQKRILLTLVLASLLKNNETTNILLLDDILANLDQETTLKLIKILHLQNFQTFITNIEPIQNELIQLHEVK